VNVTERIYNVGSSRYYSVIDIDFWTKVASHSGMRLGYAGRFSDKRINNRGLVLPNFKRDST